MPLFGNKFSPKKTPARKCMLSSEEPLEDLVLDNRVIQLKLGDQVTVFKEGEWIPESGTKGTAHKSTQKLRDKLQDLQEENNMLKLKLEIVLNMLTQSTADSHLQQREIDKLQKTDQKHKRRQ